MEAQRFPEDYDGILAGAPANAWSHMFASLLSVAQSTIGTPQAYISALKLPAIEQAALAACDAADGVKDEFINDPAKCHFDPAVLLCKGRIPWTVSRSRRWTPSRGSMRAARTVTAALYSRDS